MAKAMTTPHVEVQRLIFSCISMLSLICCIWLIVRLSRLPHAVRIRLFPRLMLLLAVSDVVFHSLKLAMYGRSILLDVCHFYAFYFWLNLALYSSLFLELLLSFAFALQSLRCPRCMRALLRLAPILLGPILVLAYLSEGKDTPSDALDCYGTAEGDRVFVGVCTSCCTISMVALAIVACRARNSSDVVEKRYLCTAATYMVNSLLTHAPLTMAVGIKVLFSARFVPAWGWMAGEVGHCLRGVANTLTFYMQSRYSSDEHLQNCVSSDSSVTPSRSFHVRFGESQFFNAGNVGALAHADLELAD